MIVVDIGCHPQGPEESVYRLADRFEPSVLFGFDPYPELQEGLEEYGPAGRKTLIVRRRLAAWVHDGSMPLLVNGIETGIDESQKDGDTWVDTFDLAAFLRVLPAGEAILKLDCEGAEYVLLPRLHDLGLDRRLARVLVEWHPEETAHGWLREGPFDLDCPVEDW